MIKLTVDTGALTKYLGSCEKEVNRSLEVALDNTAVDIRREEIDEMKRVFDNPVPYTLNSLKVTKTRNHNMQASVWFKDPERMDDHYLAPQVEGGQRKLKGFERSIEGIKFIPGAGVKLNKSGNVTVRQIKSILSAIKESGTSTDKDYVFIKRHKKLHPGIYQRFAYRENRLSGKAKKSLGVSGVHQKGMTRGRISSIIRARGLRPMLLVGKQTANVKPLLKFYDVAQRVCDKQFRSHFLTELQKRLP